MTLNSKHKEEKLKPKKQKIQKRKKLKPRKIKI